jgi:prepilin-type N-terminal cleavage/methylation domain-containing protein
MKRKIFRQVQGGGFTLFELLVSISIIGILVALGTVAYSNAQRKARDARRRQDLKGMQTVLEQYYSANNYLYPDDVACPPISSFVDPKQETYPYVKTCATFGYVVCARMEDGSGTYSGVTRCASDPCTAESGSTHHCLFNLQ